MDVGRRGVLFYDFSAHTQLYIARVTAEMTDGRMSFTCMLWYLEFRLSRMWLGCGYI